MTLVKRISRFVRDGVAGASLGARSESVRRQNAREFCGGGLSSASLAMCSRPLRSPKTEHKHGQVVLPPGIAAELGHAGQQSVEELSGIEAG